MPGRSGCPRRCVCRVRRRRWLIDEVADVAGGAGVVDGVDEFPEGVWKLWTSARAVASSAIATPCRRHDQREPRGPNDHLLSINTRPPLPKGVVGGMRTLPDSADNVRPQPRLYAFLDSWKKCPELVSVHFRPVGSLSHVIAPAEMVRP